MKNYVHTLLIVFCLTLLSGCDNYSKLVKSNDFEAQYKAAMEYYENGSFGKARHLLENLQLHYRGRDNAEDIAWYYANSVMKQDEYYLAAYQFSNFCRKYPYSVRAEEALYWSAYCKYRESPVYSLDQTMTNDAISDLEHFAEKYPQSTRIPEVNGYLDELREKLMLKDYEIAYGYYQTEAYHAAYVALKNFINLYPDSPKKEDAMFYVIRSGYEYGANSREDKMRERLEQVISDFNKFATLFQNSRYLKESQAIYTKCQALLAQLGNTKAEAR